MDGWLAGWPDLGQGHSLLLLVWWRIASMPHRRSICDLLAFDFPSIAVKWNGLEYNVHIIIRDGIVGWEGAVDRVVVVMSNNLFKLS